MFRYVGTSANNSSNSLLLTTGRGKPRDTGLLNITIPQWLLWCAIQIPLSTAKGHIPETARQVMTNSCQLNSDPGLALVQSQGPFPAQPTSNEWLMKMLQSPGPLPQLRITPRVIPAPQLLGEMTEVFVVTALQFNLSFCQTQLPSLSHSHPRTDPELPNKVQANLHFRVCFFSKPALQQTTHT